MTNIMDPFTIAREAADKEFKWWFMMLLAVLIASGLWAFRYLLNKSERDRMAYEERTKEAHTVHDGQIRLMMDTLNSSRERHATRVESLQAEIFKFASDVTKALTENTKVIEQNTRESQRVVSIIERLEKKP